MQRSGDMWVDRIPAWIKWATVEPGKMGATYDGVYWDPPEKLVVPTSIFGTFKQHGRLVSVRSFTKRRL